MSLSEFELIKQYFQAKQPPTSGVVQGIGDDAAVIQPPAGKQLVVSMDTLISGVHFPTGTSAYDIGWKSLAVNLSDMAAMGAEPSWLTLAITLPDTSSAWLEEFSAGLFDISHQYGLSLVGGDTTRGPLSISIQIAGYVAENNALLRSTAKVGDLIFVTGTIGDAALGLAVVQNKLEVDQPLQQRLTTRLNRPQPRIAEALAIRDIASSAIDISDGLLADVQHMMSASGTGAELFLEQIPLSAEAKSILEQHPEQLASVLSGGDDYELCFCLPVEKQAQLTSLSQQSGHRFDCIGRVSEGAEVYCYDHELRQVDIAAKGYDHFPKDKI